LESFSEKIKRLIASRKVRISEHGYDEPEEDGLSARAVVSGAADAILIEDYPNFAKGACGLFLQKDLLGEFIHVVWGISKGHDEPAVLVTAYRPDPRKWDQTFRRRLKQ